VLRAAALRNLDAKRFILQLCLQRIALTYRIQLRLQRIAPAYRRIGIVWGLPRTICAWVAAICSRVCADAEMGITAMKRAALIKVPIKLERVKRPRLFPLLISKPWLILSVVIRHDALPFTSSMLAQLHSFLCIFDSDVLGPATI
jgi:hypothetical protein